METKLVESFYNGKRVLITGHSGFKGSWLCRWLELMGAEVSGISLEPNTTPNHFHQLYPNGRKADYWVDICEEFKITKVFEDARPEIVFHLAAQPSVIESYIGPLNTIRTNVMGTANILNAANLCEQTKVVIIITTDKVYENYDWVYPYRETDRLGGYDIYSASKACTELITQAWRHSFQKEKKDKKFISTARAGNVLGGGDWTSERLVVDIITSRYEGRDLKIRKPESVRPWQHVLDPLHGYLKLGMYMYKNSSLTGAYNFGPNTDTNLTVEALVNMFSDFDQKFAANMKSQDSIYHEANYLTVDSAKAKYTLKWKPLLDIKKTVELTIDWYENFYRKDNLITDVQISNFMELAENDTNIK